MGGRCQALELPHHEGMALWGGVDMTAYMTAATESTRINRTLANADVLTTCAWVQQKCVCASSTRAWESKEKYEMQLSKLASLCGMTRCVRNH